MLDAADVVLGDRLLVVAEEDAGVPVVIPGQLAERGVELGARPPAAPPSWLRNSHERIPPSTAATTGLSGANGARQFDELPDIADLDHLGNLEERDLGRVDLSAGRAGEDDGVLIQDHILAEPGLGIGGEQVGHHAVEPVPDELAVPARESLEQGIDGLDPLVRSDGDLVDRGPGKAQLLELGGGGQHGLDQAEIGR